MLKNLHHALLARDRCAKVRYCCMEVAMKIVRDENDCFLKLSFYSVIKERMVIFDTVMLQFPGECILTYMEFQLDSAEYCQAQHK